MNREISLARNPILTMIVAIAFKLGQRAEARLAFALPPAATPIRYGEDPAQAIQFWRGQHPAAAAGVSVPLVVFIHGGAWTLGTPQNATGHAKIIHFASRGMAFASIGYRHVPEATVEDQARDIARALAVLVGQADTLGIDPRRVALMGHSSGAHLAALIGTDPRWLAEVGLPIEAIAGIIGIDGAAFDVVRQLRESGPIVRYLYRQAFGPSRTRQEALSPTIQAKTPNAVNWLLLHTQRPDGTRQTEALAAALRRAGSTVDVVPLAGTGLSGHIAANRRIGDPSYPGTAAVDLWLDRLFATRRIAPPPKFRQ